MMPELKTRKKRESNLELLGKLPPQAVELEEAILGAVLTERDALTSVLDILKPQMFYMEANQKIFEACMRLALESTPVDLLTVTNELRVEGVLEEIGGPYYLTQLSDRVVSAANIEFHARVVAEKFVKRELIKQCSSTIEKCYDDADDVFELISESEMHRDEVLNQISTRKEISNDDAVEAVFDHMLKMQLNPVVGLSGIPSGIYDIDKVTGGWQKSDLVILAARPAMGKTSLSLQMGINAAERGHAVAIFSIEMAFAQLTKKMLSIRSKIDFNKIYKNQIDPEDWEILKSKKNEIKNLPIFWDDTPGINITELVAKAKRMKRKHNISLIIIDYLQIIGVPKMFNRNREQEISFISRTLKALAKELNVPVICLSQLSREVEKRPGKRPMLSDLRESGSIEQDADIVTFLYRPEYYDITEDESGQSTDGVAEFMIAKHRNGETRDIKLHFNKKTTGFSEFKDNNEGFISVSPNAGLSPSKGFDDPVF